MFLVGAIVCTIGKYFITDFSKVTYGDVLLYQLIFLIAFIILDKLDELKKNKVDN